MSQEQLGSFSKVTPSLGTPSSIMFGPRLSSYSLPSSCNVSLPLPPNSVFESQIFEDMSCWMYFICTSCSIEVFIKIWNSVCLFDQVSDSRRRVFKSCHLDSEKLFYRSEGFPERDIWFLGVILPGLGQIPRVLGTSPPPPSPPSVGPKWSKYEQK